MCTQGGAIMRTDYNACRSTKTRKHENTKTRPFRGFVLSWFRANHAGLLVAVACAGVLRAEAQGNRARLAAAFPAVDRVFQQFAEQSHVPGAAWGIIVDGELAHAGAFGFRDVAAKATVDADTVFRIASMTKSFTAM